MTYPMEWTYVFEKHNSVQIYVFFPSIGNFEAGICLVFDSCSKIIRKETVADALANLFKKNSNRGDFINLAQKQLIGQSVMTSYR